MLTLQIMFLQKEYLAFSLRKIRKMDSSMNPQQNLLLQDKYCMPEPRTTLGNYRSAQKEKESLR